MTFPRWERFNYNATDAKDAFKSIALVNFYDFKFQSILLLSPGLRFDVNYALIISPSILIKDIKIIMTDTKIL